MNLCEQLIRDEGMRLKPYRDTMGLLTIGVGRNLDHRGISEKEALMLLDNDIEVATHDLLIAHPWADNLDYVRFSALVNLTFNMGINRLNKFVKMLHYMKTGQWIEAAKALLDSLYATQVGDRAKRLAKQIETGQWV